VVTDAPVQLSGSDVLPDTPVDPAALVALAQRWGLSSSLKRLVDAMAERR
jgi:hypothetical protein